MQVFLNHVHAKGLYLQERVLQSLDSKKKKIVAIAKSALHTISSTFSSRREMPQNLAPQPPQISSAKATLEGKYPKIDLGPSSSVIFNPNDGKYTYITQAPPIKNLVISGGGAKGVILLGVVQAFEEHKTNGVSFRNQLESVAGSSVGALTASLLAAGMSAADLLAATGNENFKALLGKGVGPLYKDGKPLLTFIRQNLQNTIASNLLKISGAATLDEIQNLGDKLPKGLTEAKQKELLTTLQSLVVTLKNQDVDKVRITFSMLHALTQISPETFKDLTVTATARENGKTYYFDAMKTPNLDIALACRASASLPGILQAVTIDHSALFPGYVHEKPVSFIDGGYLDNIPVSAVHDKQGQNTLHNRGEEGQNLQTLALIFDETGRKEHEQSPFHEVKLQKPIYNPNSRRERFVRDFAARNLAGLKTKERNTTTRAQGLEEMRTQYTQRSIPLLVDLKATDFDKAKKNQQGYIEKGKTQALEYLQNHDSELLYRRFDSLEALLSYLPHEEKESHLEALLAFKR